MYLEDIQRLNLYCCEQFIKHTDDNQNNKGELLINIAE